MKFTEENLNLFYNFDRKETYLVHCVSVDLAMGSGVAKQIEEIFHIRKELNLLYPSHTRYIGQILLYDNIFSLITKERYFGKPTYKSLKNVLLSLQDYCLLYKIKKLVMPRIGCGRDKLNWVKVQKIIIDTFYDTDIEIIVRTDDTCDCGQHNFHTVDRIESILP